MKLKDCKIGVSVRGLIDAPIGINQILGFVTTKPFLVKTYNNYYNGLSRISRTPIKTAVTFYIAVQVSLINGSVRYFDIRNLQKL